MLFTDLYSQKSYINNIVNRNKNRQPIFSITNRVSITTPPRQVHNENQEQTQRQNQNQNQIQNQVQTNPEPKKMKWGEPTWYLFHVLAEKVKDEHFSQIREGLLNTIYSICANLPCPDCAEHASAYMNGINYKTIKTKEQFKYMLYSFHNTVNIKKGFAVFPISELDNKYSQMNLIQVIYRFMPHFQDKSKSIRMIANDFHRSRLAEQLKQWFNSNISFFDR